MVQPLIFYFNLEKEIGKNTEIKGYKAYGN